MACGWMGFATLIRGPVAASPELSHSIFVFLVDSGALRVEAEENCCLPVLGLWGVVLPSPGVSAWRARQRCSAEHSDLLVSYPSFPMTEYSRPPSPRCWYGGRE